ncbi:N-acetyltransferase family protein [Lactococcus sp.]|uniref:GNAT family N-acetyltransferase n=1 Tax=Lactococcus sp. TaxID=44273 RepID=UPI0035B360E1
MMKIRRIDIGDTEAFWKLQKQLDQETTFMMLEPDERKYELGQAVAKVAHTDFIIGAEDNRQLIGYLSAERGHYHRVKDTAYLIIGILKVYQGQGLGHQFFKALDEWSREEKIHRAELTVMINNTQAIALYQKNGFAIEGVRKDAMCIDGCYIDEFYMSKIYENNKETNEKNEA